jgi:hypothetical protein
MGARRESQSQRRSGTSAPWREQRQENGHERPASEWEERDDIFPDWTPDEPFPGRRTDVDDEE